MSDSMPVASDRRKHVRRSVRTTAIAFLPKGQTFEVRTIDISIEGIGIVANANPREGTVFSIGFALPMRPMGLVKIKVDAKVMHSILAGDEGGFKIGLQFSRLTPEAQAAIRKYLE